MSLDSASLLDIDRIDAPLLDEVSDLLEESELDGAIVTRVTKNAKICLFPVLLYIL